MFFVIRYVWKNFDCLVFLDIGKGVFWLNFVYRIICVINVWEKFVFWYMVCFCLLNFWLIRFFVVRVLIC